MSVATVHVLHGIANGGMFLSEISNARPVTNLDKILSVPAGLPFPLFCGELGQKPACPFDTTEVKTVLDQTNALIGIIDLSGANTDLLLKKVQYLGRRVADANPSHKRLRMSEAYLVLDRISAGHRKEATATCRLVAIFDGTNAPIVAVGSVTLSGTPGNAGHYTAGPMWLSVDSGLTVAVPAIQDLTIDFRRQLVQAGGEGELYDTFGGMLTYSPLITVSTLDFNWDTYGINAHKITAASWYLRKKGAPPIADGTPEHIKFTAAAGTAYIEESSMGGNQPAMTTLACDLVAADASTEPIAVNTAITIT